MLHRMDVDVRYMHCSVLSVQRLAGTSFKSYPFYRIQFINAFRYNLFKQSHIFLRPMLLYQTQCQTHAQHATNDIRVYIDQHIIQNKQQTATQCYSSLQETYSNEHNCCHILGSLYLLKYGIHAQFLRLYFKCLPDSILFKQTSTTDFINRIYKVQHFNVYSLFSNLTFPLIHMLSHQAHGVQTDIRGSIEQTWSF